jgi:hypothetical protein
MNSDRSRSSAYLTIAAVAAAVGLATYAIYFDYKRRNDTGFRKKLSKLTFRWQCMIPLTSSLRTGEKTRWKVRRPEQGERSDNLKFHFPWWTQGSLEATQTRGTAKVTRGERNVLHEPSWSWWTTFFSRYFITNRTYIPFWPLNRTCVLPSRCPCFLPCPAGLSITGWAYRHLSENYPRTCLQGRFLILLHVQILNNHCRL